MTCGMNNQILTNIGLCFDITGAIIIFIFGISYDKNWDLPEPKLTIYRLSSRTGVFLLIIGFSLQLSFIQNLIL